ncbi:hypothetical protein BKA65DRAFT_475914 [Rhexocercosporidium sp. MPI-PUGE-AT-0058]|nr:hypothetical protein BKA65DRAFT_475914 [Rhexocercosporidium sp. MPI-PUGE-AT-0058]
MAEVIHPTVTDEKHHWSLIESHIEPLVEQTSPQADIKENIDIADVLSKLENERRERNAIHAPQVSPKEVEPPIWIPFENGIHVSPGSAPEVAYISSPTSSDGPTLVPSTTTNSDSSPKMLEDSSPRPPTPRILGLEKKTFWILALALLLVASILAGTLGGVLSSRAKHKKEKLQMHFSLQTWENANLTGRSQIFDRAGLFTTSFKARSYSWLPGFYNDDGTYDVCSMSFCQGDHQIGWWGSSEHVSGNGKWQGYDFGDTVLIKCGSVFADPLCPLTRDKTTMTAPIYDVPAAPTASASGGGGNSTVSMSSTVMTTSAGVPTATGT